MSDIKVKICGLTTEEAVRTVVDAEADYAGFVFFPGSPRNLTIQQAAKLRALLPASIPAIAVVVDADDELLGQILSVAKLDMLQLHGNETPERIKAIKARFGIPVIKAIKVKSSDDVARAGQFAESADYLLFDAKAPEHGGMLPGGNGLAFDWMLLANRSFSKPWFLSGGLNIENVQEALSATGARMVDVSSSVEASPGVKDPALIRQFIAKAKTRA